MAIFTKPINARTAAEGLLGWTIILAGFTFLAVPVITLFARISWSIINFIWHLW